MVVVSGLLPQVHICTVKFNNNILVVVGIAKGKIPWLIMYKLPLQGNQNNL